MAKISSYQINSDYTGLRQLPNRYTTTIRFGGSTYSNYSALLATGTVTIPSGVWVDSILLKSSYLDLNYVGHYGEYFVSPGQIVPGVLGFYVTRTSTTTFRIDVDLYVGSGYSMTIPSSTLDVTIKLSPAPFS